MQQDIFGAVNEPAKHKKGLAIAAKGKEALSKKQKEFNKLVKKLEKLRSDLALTRTTLDDSLVFYAAHLHPLEEQLVGLRTRGVKIFYSFYKEKKLLSKNDKEVLGDVIMRGLEELLSLTAAEPDDEIKTIFKAVNGISYEEAKKDSFDEMKDEMEDMFEEMGFEVNFDGIDENMSEEEMMRKMKEKHEEFIRQAEEKDEKNAKRKKTRKQLEREEKEKQMEAARSKNIGAIYKQLAKMFHPDLETDETLKVQKEELMKQLTVAYENNDLHTLLKLEIAWIQNEEANIERLSDDKLGIYNEVLKEQLEEAEEELDMLVSHPRYMRLQRYAEDPMELSAKHMERERAQLKEIVTSLGDAEADLTGKDALMHVKYVIKASKRQAVTMTSEWDDVLEQLMRMKG